MPICPCARVPVAQAPGRNVRPVRLWGSWTPWIDAYGGDLLTFGRASGGQSIWSTFYKDDPRAAGRAGGIKWGAPIVNSPSNVEALQFLIDLGKEDISPVATVAGATENGLFAGNKTGTRPHQLLSDPRRPAAYPLAQRARLGHDRDRVCFR